MKQDDFLTRLINNPAYIAGLTAVGNPLGEALLKGSAQNRENQLKEAQIGEFERKKQEDLRKQKIEENLPKALEGIDFNNPDQAFEQMRSREVPFDTALTIIKHFADINNQQGQLGVSQGNLDINRQELGLNRARFGFEQQKHAFEMSGAKSAADIFKGETELRKELHALPISKETSFVKNAYEKVKALMDKPNPTGADDTAALTLAVKVNDAMSTVSTSESGAYKEAQGFIHKWEGKLQQIQAKGFYTPEDRKALKSMVKDAYKVQLKNYKEQTEPYKRIGEEQGFNSKNYLTFDPQDEQEDNNTPLTDNTNEFSDDYINQLKSAAGGNWER